MKHNNIRILLAFLSIYIVWGTTFLAISYGLVGFPPFILAGLRFLVAGIILMSWLYFKGERATNIKSWKQNTVSGILILTIGVGSVTWAEQYISSTEAAIIIASEPFWFILLDKKNRQHYKSNKLAIGGLIIGFLGLLLFFKDSLSITTEADTTQNSLRVLSFVVLLGSALIWVLGSLYSKKDTGASLFMNVAQQLIVGGIAAIIIASIRGEWQDLHWANIPIQAWMGLIYLIIFGSVIAYLAFIWLLSVKPAALVSTHTFVNPIVAVIAGVIIANEHITLGQTWALVVIIIGVIITNIVQYKLSKRTQVKLRKTRRSIIRLGQPYANLSQFNT